VIDRAELAAFVAAARAAWPGIELADDAFVRHVEATAKDGALPPAQHAGDLWLACACAHGIPAALRAFDAALAPVVARAVARIDSSSSFCDVVAQELRTKLLVGSPSKIAEYGGLAPLGAWLKTAATRTALNLRRGKAEEAHDSVSSGIWARAGGPDAQLLRARFREELKAALAQALARMSTRERAMLSLNVRDGMSIDKLAEAYGVGRSTAARWLAAAREQLERETKKELEERLKLTPSELRSLADEVKSHIDVSLGGLLDANA
jgi:RNA polymerase sigma-70 factor (ECF subfamily)